MAEATAFRGDPAMWSAAFISGVRVVAETDDWIVVDKPAPQQVHPSKPGNPPTLLDELYHLLAYEMVNGARLSIINRLDRETSGLVLVAKNRDMARIFGKAMMRRQIQKKYLAIVHGWPERDTFVVEGALRRRGEFEDSPVRLMQAVHPDGAPSRTECRVLRRFTLPEQVMPSYFQPGAPLALIEASPITGRMHQIRVHLSHLGHPIVGDKLYGLAGPEVYLSFIETGWSEILHQKLLLPRHALHSCHLSLEIDSMVYGPFSATLPPDLSLLLGVP